MPRLIDADELTMQIMSMIEDKAILHGNDAVKGSKEIFALAMVTQAPTVDAEPVRRGEWTVTPIYIKCSECGESFMLIPQNYCPNCGARMDKDGR